MPKILPHAQIAEGTSSLNSKQRKAFNITNKWAKDYAKYNRHTVEPVHIFLSDIGGTGKSHLIKVIDNVISKSMLYRCKGPEKPSSFT